MRTLLFTLSLFFLMQVAYGQNTYSVRGKVADTATNAKLFQTAVSILNEKDSILVKYNWADREGAFQIGGLPAGSYILLVSYPDYADYVYFFELNATTPAIDFRTISLSPKARLLKEVLIQGKVNAIKLKGDTTEFNARAFVIQPHAKVEDLLRQLPGIQVDNNGKITAQGQTVRKVLVDGEEFFGDDPTLVTRNLRADMIDKVQLYDKKSDQAAFTGVDDGVENKTINLILKEDKKKGYFGKVEAGGGTADFYQLQAMANLFREKQKMAAYGNMGNTGRTGLSSSENNKYGTDGGTLEFISGGVVLTGSNADDIESNSGRFNGQGIPLSRTSGAHYDGKWNADKESINTNLKVGALATAGERNTISQNDLPDGRIQSRQLQNFSTSNFRQRLDASYQININPETTFRLKIDGIRKQSESTNTYTSNSVNAENLLLNRQQRRISDDGDQQALNVQAFYSRKLKKPGRAFSWNIIQNLMRENTAGFLKAENELYTDGQRVNTQITDQFKDDRKVLNAFNSNLTFAEPLSKTSSLGINYRLGMVRSDVERESYNPGANGYTVKDAEFSNHFILNQLSNQAGATFTYQKGKAVARVSGRFIAVALNQTDQYTQARFTRNFMNVNPQVDYRYSFAPQQTLMLGYNGNTIQPTIDQIQPVRINTDPLNLLVGNADLRPAFAQNFSFSYSAYKPVSGFSINLIAAYDLTTDPIVSSVNTDAFGRSVYQSLNADRSARGMVFRGDLGKQLKAIGGFVGWNFFYSSRKDIGLINNVLNLRQSNTFTSAIQFSKSKTKKYDLMIGFGPRFFTGNSSVQHQLENNGYGYDGFLTWNVYLPHKFEFRSSSTANYQSATAAFDEPYRVFIVDAVLARKFLKDESLKLSVSVKDLLNQNIGFNRRTYGTMITQTNFTAISRYVMCSLSWDFSRFGKSLTPNP